MKAEIASGTRDAIAYRLWGPEGESLVIVDLLDPTHPAAVPEGESWPPDLWPYGFAGERSPGALALVQVLPPGRAAMEQASGVIEPPDLDEGPVDDAVLRMEFPEVAHAPATVFHWLALVFAAANTRAPDELWEAQLEFHDAIVPMLPPHRGMPLAAAWADFVFAIAVPGLGSGFKTGADGRLLFDTPVPVHEDVAALVTLIVALLGECWP